MPVQLNSAGVPKGTGALNFRGCAWWMIYSDEAGRKIQASTGTGDYDKARRVLARAAIPVLQAQLAKLREIRDEGPHQPATGAGTPRGRGAHHRNAETHAGSGKKNSRGESR
jgi:hypothetical protein